MTEPKNIRRRKSSTPAPGGADARAGAEFDAQRSAAQNRALLAAMLDPTVVIDDRGTIQAASDSVLRVFLYSPQELVGQNVKVLMAEPHRSAHDGYLENYHRTGQTNILGRTREFEVVRKDGSPIVCELSVARADFPGGPRFIGSFRDVTDRKRAEAALRDSERRFRALFDGVFQFMGLLSPDGTVLEANHAACDAGGVRRDEVIGKPFWETRWWSHSKPMQEKIRDAVERAARGEFVRFEISQRGRDDTILDVDFSLMPVRNDTGEVVLLIPEGRDVTELKSAQRSETAMLRALATIGESAAVLAHEMKNPITAVNVALRAVAEELGEDHRLVLEDLVARMQRVEQIMRRTLSFARPLAMRRAELDVESLFATTAEHLKTELEKSASSVKFDVPRGGVRLIGDRQLLEEVLANLVMNAIEAKGSGVNVEFAARRSGRDGVLITVEDDGPGIPEARRGSIFNPFVTTKQSGTGLGLAICKKIVEEHGGAIAVESSAQGGARFVIQLKSRD